MMNKQTKGIRLVATDLDGTFLKNDHSISLNNLEALYRLGSKNIIRVAATGRSLKKVKEVIKDEIPFDFIVYSMGTGIFNWKAQQQIFIQNIGKQSVQKLLKLFVSQSLNFFAFFPAPENHRYWFYRGNEPCVEFERYFKFNEAYETELIPDAFPDSELSQMLVIIPEDESLFLKIKSEIEFTCPEIRVIRSSSPITKGYIWMEIFHHLVSKGNGVKHICSLMDIKQDETMGLGNDYNDLDLLQYTCHSFLTKNAPTELKNLYPLVPANEQDGFARTVEKLERKNLIITI